MNHIYKGVLLGVCLLLLGTSFNAHAATDFEARLNSLLQQISTLQAEVAALQAEYKREQGGSTPAASLSFTKDLREGMNDVELRVLQQILGTDKAIYADGRVTGLFGPLTKEALTKFQSRFGISGEAGYVGPETRRVLNKILSVKGVGKTIPPGLLSDSSLVSLVTTTPTPPVSEEMVEICHNGQDLRLPIRTAAIHIATHTDDEMGKCKDSSDDEGEDDEDEDRDQGDPESFTIEIKNRRAHVEVEFENGSSDDYILNLFDEDDIIDELAERYDLDTEDVEEMIDFEDKSEVDEITVVIDEDEARVTVTFEDNDTDTEKFTVDSDDEDDIIEEIAERYDMDEEEVEDITDFEDEDSEEVEEIRVEIRNNKAYVTVEYEDGDEDEFVINDDDHDDIEEELAERLDMDEDDIEDLIEYEEED